MQLNEEGNRLFSAAQDGQLILWDAHKGTMRKLVTPKSDWVLCCALNNSGTIGASGGMNNILSVCVSVCLLYQQCAWGGGGGRGCDRMPHRTYVAATWLEASNTAW
jgi:hypothetical protein